ncbi:S-phase kinase-associated protein 1, partial [Taenia solium]
RVKLVTADKVTFDADLEIARQSGLIRDILDDVGLEAAEDNGPIPLLYVNGVKLQLSEFRQKITLDGEETSTSSLRQLSQPHPMP